MALPERDWKHLRSVHRTALDRYCAQVLREASAIISDATGTAHDRYVRLYRLLQERDAALGAAFDDLRRSTAIPRLAAMLQLNVVTDEEFGEFSAATRDSATLLSELSRPAHAKRGAS